MKSVRLSGLAASTALALVLALSSQPGQAQSTGDSQAQVAAPMPDGAAKPMDKPAEAAKSVAKDAANDTTAQDSAAQDSAAQNPAAPDTVAKDSAANDTAAKPANTPTENATAANPTTTGTVKPEANSKADTASVPAKTEDETQAKAPVEAPAATAAIPETTPADSAAAKDAGSANAPAQTGSTTEPAAASKQAAVTPAEAPPTVADNAVADALKDMIASRLDRYVPRKQDREGVEAFYKKRDYKPLWVANGAADTRAEAAIAYLASVAADGLDPNDYPTPNFNSDSTAGDLAAAELQLTNAVLIYAHDAQVGRIHFTRVGSDISFKLDEPEPAAVLAKMAETNDVAAALDGYNPPQAGFKALKAKLAELRKGETATSDADAKKVARVSPGRILRPGMRDARVAQIRQRLDIPGDKSNTLYDDTVFKAVKAFQKKAGIGIDGMAGPNTVSALNGNQGPRVTPRDPIETVIVNMERWRWLPRKLANSNGDYVMVNVPDYSLKLVHDGKIDWKTRIVVGKPGKATPMTTAEMKYITVNPTWNVPPSIIENEYLPALEQDPTVLDRYGLKIKQGPDGVVRIWQPPGAANALGRVRFNFPNKFLVYQHDTPDKYLFKRAKRAYSHGCMRVQNPAEYAAKLLSLEMPQDHYTPAKVRSMYGDSEININFPRPIPVHLTYQTAFVDQNGKLQFREDVYGRDRRMIAILRNTRERRIAYIPVQLPPNTSAKPVRMPVGMFPGDGGPSYDNGPNLFEMLFGGGDRSSLRQSYRPYRGRHFLGPRAADGGRYSRR